MNEKAGHFMGSPVFFVSLFLKGLLEFPQMTRLWTRERCFDF